MLKVDLVVVLRASTTRAVALVVRPGLPGGCQPPDRFRWPTPTALQPLQGQRGQDHIVAMAFLLASLGALSVGLQVGLAESSDDPDAEGVHRLIAPSAGSPAPMPPLPGEGAIAETLRPPGTGSGRTGDLPRFARER